MYSVHRLAWLLVGLFLAVDPLVAGDCPSDEHPLQLVIEGGGEINSTIPAGSLGAAASASTSASAASYAATRKRGRGGGGGGGRAGARAAARARGGACARVCVCVCLYM